MYLPMKRYLIYIVIISLGTLLTPTALQKPTLAHTQALSSIAPVSTEKPVATLAASVTPNPTQQPTPQPQTQQTSSTQATAPVTQAAPAAPSYPSDHVAIMAAAGIDPSDYSYVDYILSHESGWCATKWEGEYGTCPGYYEDFYGPYSAQDTYKGYGLCQSTPAIKMSSAGADWELNPVTQMSWCNSYAVSRYGSWYGAYVHWINNGNW